MNDGTTLLQLLYSTFPFKGNTACQPLLMRNITFSSGSSILNLVSYNEFSNGNPVILCWPVGIKRTVNLNCATYSPLWNQDIPYFKINNYALYEPYVSMVKAEGNENKNIIKCISNHIRYCTKGSSNGKLMIIKFSLLFFMTVTFESIAWKSTLEPL